MLDDACKLFNKNDDLIFKFIKNRKESNAHSDKELILFVHNTCDMKPMVI